MYPDLSEIVLKRRRFCHGVPCDLCMKQCNGVSVDDDIDSWAIFLGGT
jgi:hypothetical protein